MWGQNETRSVNINTTSINIYINTGPLFAQRLFGWYGTSTGTGGREIPYSTGTVGIVSYCRARLIIQVLYNIL
jgi:hypothetical protein